MDEFQWKKVVDYKCLKCKKQRSTRNKEVFARKICTKCKKAEVDPRQVPLFP